MKLKVYLNGIYLDEDHAQIPITDRSYLAGIGLFETFRSYKGNLLFIEEHFKRLEAGAKGLEIKLPLSLAKLKAIVQETLSLNQLMNAIVRIYLTPQGESIGDYDLPAKKINLLISCHPFHPFPSEYYQQGVSCKIITTVQAEKGILASFKTTSYLNRIFARLEAKRAGAFEGILLNEEGHITEGASSNLFIIKKEKIFTPPIEEGLMPGITRRQIFRIAKQDEIPLKEKILLPKDLVEADEIFITSSLKEVMPVALVDDKKPRLLAPGPLTQKLMESYRDLIQWEIENESSDQD